MMRLSVLIGMIAILFCGSAEQEAMQPTVMTRQLMDEAVIETVLVEVLTSSDDVSRRILREQGGEQLIFNNECYDRVFTSTKAILIAREKWEFPKFVDPAAIREAGENVLDRIKRKELYEPFKSQDKRISISKEDPASSGLGI